MKPLFCINLTDDKGNEQDNGQEFLVATPSSTLAQVLDRSAENAVETIKASNLPLPLSIIQGVCGIGGLLLFIVIIRVLLGDESIPLAKAYQNTPWLFWTTGIALAIWAILALLGHHKEKTVLASEESEQTFDNLEKACDAVWTELAVPDDAKTVDILTFFYKEKGSEIKLCEKMWQMAPYSNPIYRAFRDTENLYLANLDGKSAIPLSSIKAIRTVKKTIRIEEWNKDEPHNKGIYKQYKLALDKYDCVSCKPYHIMEFERDGELWGLYIPCYELPIFEELTGMVAK